MWFVYLVKCSDNTLYCGITNNLEKRIAAHNSDRGAKYTKSRRPVVLFKVFEVSNKSEALKLEIKIKKMSREEKINL